MFQFFRSKLQNNKDALQLYLGNALITLSSFIIVASLAHILSTEIYGIYRFVITISTLAITLGSLGFANALYYYLSSSEKPSHANQINSSRIALLIMAIITLLITKLIFVFFENKLQSFQFNQYQWIIAGIVLIGILQSIELNVFLINKKVRIYMISNLILIVFRVITLCLAYYQNWSLMLLLQVHLALSFCFFVLNQILINQYNLIKHFSFDWTIVKTQFKYGFPIGLGLFFGVLLLNTDRIILTSFFPDPAQFAVIANGNFEVPIITQFYIAFSAIALPLLIEAYQSKNIDRFLEIRLKYQQEIILILFPIVFALMNWSGPIIRMIFGANYSDSAPLFMIFAGSFLIRFTSHHDVFLATKQTKYISIIQGIELIFHLVLTYVLILNFGIIGSSYAYLLTNIFYFLITSYISAKIISVSIWKIHAWKSIIPNLLLCAFILTAFRSMDAAFIYSDIQALLLAGVYVVFCYIFLNYRHAVILKNG